MFHNFHIILDLKVHVKSFSRSLSMAIGQQIFAPLGQPPQSQRRCQRRIECPPYKISVSSWVIVFVVQKTLHFHTPFWSARLKCPVTLEFHDSIYQLLVNYKFSKVQSWGKVCYILYKGSTYKKYNRLFPMTVFHFLTLHSVIPFCSLLLCCDQILMTRMMKMFFSASSCSSCGHWDQQHCWWSLVLG